MGRIQGRVRDALNMEVGELRAIEAVLDRYGVPRTREGGEDMSTADRVEWLCLELFAR
jgi:hypothetical protein